MQFEKQKYQEECVSNIIEILKDFNFKHPKLEDLKQGLNNFYNNNGKALESKNYLLYKTQQSNLVNNKKTTKNKAEAAASFSQNIKLDILMETGTGKTFTYIKTIFELNKEHGVNKFIIFVPRKAIRLGIKQNIELTKSYFKTEYAKQINLMEYEGRDSLSNIERFLNDNDKDPTVLLLTDSAINKKNKNILNSRPEKTFFGNSQLTYLQAIQKVNPVIIIDEPHLLTGDKFIESIEGFTNLFLRFGATFPKTSGHELSNMSYCLDSITAFQEYLVKRINVSVANSTMENSWLVKETKAKKSFIVSYIENGNQKEVEIKLKEDIGVKIHNSKYYGVYATKIIKDIVYLSNHTEHKVADYTLSEEEQRVLIQQTIQTHFNKEEELFNKGIKTLSLFFIKNIADFKGDKPIIKNMFDEEYKKIRAEVFKKPNLSEEYKQYLQLDYDNNNNLAVRDGYFTSNKGTNEEDEAKNVELILNKKEELLSLKIPLRFIFSVWALQEGWDNPNIFNICKLAPTKQENSKRQQVGRGLRIAVNQNGQRLTYNYLEEQAQEFYKINTLDVLISQREDNFIETLQQEIIADSYINTTGRFTWQDIEEKAQVKGSSLSRLIIALEDSNIIKENEDKSGYQVLSSINSFLKNSQDKLKFLTEKEYQNLLNYFVESNNREKQVSNAKDKIATIKINPNLYKEFEEMWQHLNKKAQITYKDIQENEIISEVVTNFAKEEDLTPISITMHTKQYNAQTNTIENIEEKSLGNIEFFKDKGEINNYILEISKAEQYPLNFIIKIFNAIKNNKKAQQNFINNPKLAKTKLMHFIKEAVHSKVANKISYNFNNINISSSNFSNNDSNIFKKDENGNFIEISHTLIGKEVSEASAPENYLYDKIVFDSKIEEESSIDDDKPLEISGKKYEIKVYAKLPKIHIPTPYKTYNPDFAYCLVVNNKKILLVLETKGYNYNSDISKEEQNKIDYAKSFFKSLQQEVGDSLQVEFKTRINKQKFIDILKEITTS